MQICNRALFELAAGKKITWNLPGMKQLKVPYKKIPEFHHKLKSYKSALTILENVIKATGVSLPDPTVLQGGESSNVAQTERASDRFEGQTDSKKSLSDSASREESCEEPPRLGGRGRVKTSTGDAATKKPTHALQVLGKLIRLIHMVMAIFLWLHSRDRVAWLLLFIFLSLWLIFCSFVDAFFIKEVSLSSLRHLIRKRFFEAFMKGSTIVLPLLVLPRFLNSAPLSAIIMALSMIFAPKALHIMEVLNNEFDKYDLAIQDKISFTNGSSVRRVTFLVSADAARIAGELVGWSIGCALYVKLSTIPN